MSKSSLSAANQVAVAPALLERHAAALRQYLALLPGAEVTRVEAVVQEVLAEIQAETDLDDDPAIWLFAHGRRRLTGSGQRGEAILAQTDEPAEADETAEDGPVAVHRAFARLTSKQQEALRLKFQFGFNSEEIARITALSGSAAAGLLHHAVERVVGATAAGRGEAAALLHDPWITAYAFDEMSADERQAFVESGPDGKALLAGTEAIRQAGRHLTQILESGAPLPKRRRRKGGGGRSRTGIVVVGVVVAALAAAGWYFFARTRPAEESVKAPRDGSIRSAPATAPTPAAAPTERRAGAGVAAETEGSGTPRVRRLKAGATAPAPISGGRDPAADSEDGGADTPAVGGARSPGSARGPLGESGAPAEGGGEQGELESALSTDGTPRDISEELAPTDADRREPPMAQSTETSAARPARDGLAVKAKSDQPKPAPRVATAGGESAGTKPPRHPVTPGVGALKQKLAQRQWPRPEDVKLGEWLQQAPPEPAPEPASAAEPLAPRVEVAVSPWAPEKLVVRVSVRARAAPPPARRPANLVLAVDVSESMRGPNRLPLVQEGVRLLAGHLRPDDRVGVVTYAARAMELLPPQPLGEQARELRSSLNGLQAAGRTNGYEGLLLAYAAARRAKVEGGLNVVVLCTDGNFNLGETNDRALAELAAQAAADGITLSVFGFGRSDRNDLRLELLAQQGGGRSCYVNTREEAERLLAGQIDGLLAPVAEAVELQVDFAGRLAAVARRLGDEPPEPVAALLPGGSLTALFEVPAPGAQSDQAVALGSLQVQYRESGTGRPGRLRQPLAGPVRAWPHAAEGFRFAVAMAELVRVLRGDAASAGPDLDRLEAWVRVHLPNDAGGYRLELLETIATARQIAVAAGR